VPPRFNFFVVFDANAAATGLLKPADARDVISFYVLMKGHFEGFDYLGFGNSSQHF
jgi:hypothetical protein